MEYFYMTDAGTRLRTSRKAAGYKSVEKAVANIAITASAMYMHEKGRNAINSEQAAVYGKAFNVSPAWILYGDADQEPRILSDDDIQEVHRLASESITKFLKAHGPKGGVPMKVHTQMVIDEAEKLIDHFKQGLIKLK